MHMGDYDVLDLFGIYVQHGQTFRWRSQISAAPALPLSPTITNINNNCAHMVTDDPDEVIHGQGGVVGIAMNEDRTPLAHALAVFNGKDLITVVVHDASSVSLLGFSVTLSQS